MNNHDDDMRSPELEAMRFALDELFIEVQAGGLQPADLNERLEQIHGDYLGEEASTLEWVERRRRAVKAFNALGAESTSRHHELELLAEALGIGAIPG